MVWFKHRVKRQPYPFAKAIEERAAFLQNHLGLYANDVFVKVGQVEGDQINGKVGFRLSDKFKLPKNGLLEAEIEVVQPTLFVTLECLVHDDFACFSMMLLLQSFGFDPVGPSIERYAFYDLTRYL